MKLPPACTCSPTTIGNSFWLVRLCRRICAKCDTKCWEAFNKNGTQRIRSRTLDGIGPIGIPCQHCDKKVLVNYINIGKQKLACRWCNKEFIIEIESDKIVIGNRDYEYRIGYELRGDTNIHYETHLENAGELGVRGTTPIVIKVTHCTISAEYEARMGFAIMGSVNFDECIDANPFDPNFCDNYVSGRGNSREEAINNLKKELRGNSDALFA